MSFPNGWTQHRLREITLINPSREIVHNLNLLVSFVPMEDVSESAKIKGTKVRNYKNVSKGYTPFQNGDILVAKITPCFENGKGALAENLSNGLGFGSTEFHVIRAKEEYIDKKYLYFLTLSHEFRRRGEINMQGSAGQQRVPTDFLASYSVVLPPLPEQRKIANILSTWDEAIDLTEQLIIAKQKRKQALIQRLLTGKVRFSEFEEELKEVKLQDVADINSENITESSSSEKMYYYIDLSSINNGGIDFPNEKVPFKQLPSRARRVLHKYDVIMSTVRPHLLGYARCTFDPEDVLCSTGFAIITPHHHEQMNFIYQSIYSDYVQKQISTLVTGSNYPAINSSEVAQLKLVWPQSDRERAQISNLLTSCDNELDLLSQKLTALRQQKKGLMQQLLTGKIRVKI